MRKTLHLRLLAALSMLMSALAALVAAPSSPAAAQTAAQTKPVEITVTKVRCATDCRNTGLEDAGESAADFYGIIRINGVAQQTRRAAPDQELVEVKWPELGGVWVESVDVPRTQQMVPVSIEIWDHDGSSGNDLGDASPAAGRAALEFQFDTLTGALSGDITSPAACATGNGEPGGGFLGADAKPPVEVCVLVNADRDGDGLFDSWETGGIDVNRDETVDLALHLPPFNADPLKKDLFVESDFMADPTHSHAPAAGALQDVVDSFAAAPVTTFGGLVKPGIALHAMLDEQLAEVPSFLFDSVGPNANDDFNDLKLGTPANPCDGAFGTPADRSSPNCANILAAKKLVFRYSIFGHDHTESPGSSGRAELDPLGGNDFIVTLGSFTAADIAAAGGQRAADAGTYMHELGHNLSLRHGGFEDTNCKPNYRSVMNYTLQFANKDPNRPLTFSADVLPTLEEDATSPKPGLNESTGIDGPAGQLAVYGGTGGNERTAPADGAIDWNDNKVVPEASVSADVNFINTIGPAPMNGGCNGATPNQTLAGYDDWNHIVYSFWNSRFFADGAHPTPVTEISNEILRMMTRGTDLAVSQADAPDPVAAGSDLVYTVTVANGGGNPANSVEVVDTLPDGVTYRSSTGSCTPAAGVATCQLGSIPAGESRSFTISVGVPANLVHDNGGPKQLTNRVEVRSPESPDPIAGNNTSSESTMVVAVADVKISGATASGPLEMLVGQSATASISVTAENGGPSSPVDAVITTTPSADPGISVSPATATSEQVTLAVGSPRTVTSTVVLECRSPGLRTVAVQAGVRLTNAADTDPDVTNNQRSVSFTVDCVVPIAINVRPNGSPNSINLNTDATLAALTTRAGEYGLPLDVDATTIDVSSVRWGLRSNLLNTATPTGAAESHGKGHPERSYELDETTVDGDLDLVLHFKPSESGLTAASTEGCLKGRLRGADGGSYTFLGCDSVRIVPQGR
jgi:uncharacterized repeat protein (TIGR01451 family)